jgi:F-type H+-transporting ATPase subunit delta
VATSELAAKRYARAAFELAAEKGEVQAWVSAIDRLVGFMSDPGAKRVLENTRVAQDRKQHLIQAALGDLPPLMLNLARLLVQKGRTNIATQVAEEFKRLAEVQQGIARARAITAVALNDEEREILTRRLRDQTGRKVLLETQVDPHLLGGVIVQIGDRLIDGSAKARLEALRRSLEGAM